MKKLTHIALVLALVLCFALTAFAAFPKPIGYINDFAQIIPPQTESALDNLLRELKQKTTADVVVVTIDDLGDASLEGYAVDLFENWGIGKKGKDNGVLILVAMAQRKVRIEVGYGLEGIIPDGRAGDIIRQQITPNFKGGDYGKGILQCTLAVVNIIATDAGVQLRGMPRVTTRQYPQRSHRGRGLASLIMLVLLIIFFFRYPRLFSLLLLGSMLGGGRRGGYWSGGGGGFGGGFGGFGGGMSGGGGASGGW